MTSLGLGTVFAMGATAPIMYTGVVIVSGVPGKLTDPFMASVSYTHLENIKPGRTWTRLFLTRKSLLLQGI